MIATNVISAPARMAAVGMYAPRAACWTTRTSRSMVETTDEWIVQRTGIRTRHVVSDGQFTSHLAIAAIDDLLATIRRLHLTDVDYIVVGSTTPDYEYPSLSAMLQAHYGLLKTVGALDIKTACAAFAYGINLACGLIGTGQARRVLVVTADSLTRSVDYTDRATCVLFGDGAGQRCWNTRDAGDLRNGFRIGRQRRQVSLPHGDAYRNQRHRGATELLRQEGQSVYRWVLENVPPVVIASSRAPD